MNGRSLQIRIAGDSIAAQKALRELGIEAQRAGHKVTDSFGKSGEAMTRMQRRAQEMGDVATGSFTKVAGSLGKLVGAAGIGGLALAIGKAGLGFQDFQQKSQLAFATMLGSADKAKTFLADILAFAKETPFKFKDLTSSAQNLVSFGVDAERVIPILRTLTDTAIGAGKGIQEIDGMASVIGQISAKGRLQTEEILQLAERGVPAMAVLANKAGKTVMEFQKDVSAGLIDSNQAIDWLVDGLAKGTQGINGFTPAYEGLSKALKESGGITATMDAATSAFTQASSELMKSLVPSLLSLVDAGTDVLGVVKWLAERLNALPKPVRDAALALGALAVANKALNFELGPRSQAMFTGFVRGLDTSRVAMHSAGRQASTFRLGLDAVKSSARGARTVLSGAFGGPFGIAIAGLTLGLSTFASVQAKAKARTQELKDSLDQTTAALTEQSRALMYDEIFESDRYERIDALAEKLGITMTDVVSLGLNDATDATAALGAQMEFLRGELAKKPGAGVAPFIERTGMSADDARVKLRYYNDLMQEMSGFSANTSKAQEELRDKIGAVSGPINDLGNAYTSATRKALNFTSTTDPVVKAIQEQANAAANAFSSATGVGTFKLNLSTKDDVTKAQEAVAEATKNLRREEQQLAETRSRKDVKGSSLAAAEDAVTDARKRAAQAAKNLADVEARRDPVAQYRKQLKEQQKAAETFRADMIKLAEQGLNGTTFQELLLKGPEGSADARKALLGDKSLIGETNAFQETMAGYTKDIEWMAKANAARLHFGGEMTAVEFNLGLKAGLLEGSVDTLQALADKLGSNPAAIREVGKLVGAEFMKGFSDYSFSFDAKMPRALPGMPVQGFATGGIYPGYTPGRDIGFIGVSGGEAIMRPEFTRAMGADWIHRMNALARTAGVGGVQKEMQRFLGGFANGGIPAPRFSHAQPQVIRVTESQTVGYPVTVENMTVNPIDVQDFERQLRRRSSARRWTGGYP